MPQLFMGTNSAPRTLIARLSPWSLYSLALCPTLVGGWGSYCSWLLAPCSLSAHCCHRAPNPRYGLRSSAPLPWPNYVCLYSWYPPAFCLGPARHLPSITRLLDCGAVGLAIRSLLFCSGRGVQQLILLFFKFLVPVLIPEML